MTGPNGLKGGIGSEYLFSGSRDGTLKRWELGADEAVCGATFESHVDWVFIRTMEIGFFPYFQRLNRTFVYLCIFLYKNKRGVMELKPVLGSRQGQNLDV